MTPSAAPRTPAWRRVAPTVVLVAASALVTGAIAVADSVPAPTVGGEATRFVPTEGLVSWSLETGGEVDIRRVVEHARTTGVTEVLALPQYQAGVVLEQLGDSVRTTPFWRETTHVLDGDDARILTDLYHLTDAGLALAASHGGDLGWVYEPPMVMLPADVADGSTWEGRGQAIPLGIASYEQSSRALSPSDAALLTAAESVDVDPASCLQVDSTVTLRDEHGDAIVELRQRELWCEALGRLAATVEFDGTRTHFAPTEPRPDAFGVRAAPTGSVWDAAAEWVAREAPLQRDDAFFGTGELTVSLLGAPRVTSSGLVIVPHTTTNDVIALRVERERLVQAWLAHPGGSIVTLGTVGDVTLVSTSRRELVAYDARGNRLWQAGAPELVIAPPTGTRDGRVVTVGLDGTVTMRDALTGERDWETPLGSDIELPAVVGDGSVVVTIDRAGTITALDAATGEVLWSRASPTAAGLRVIDGFLVSVGDDGWMRSFDAATGQPGHSWRYQGASRALLRAGDAAVLATDEHVVAVDLDTGAVLWRGDGVSAAAGDGRTIVTVRGTAATALSEAGEELAAWRVPASFIWSHQHLVAAADRILIMHSGTTATVVGPR